MGMFDYVNYEAPCIECGELLTVWQTKSTKCTMSTVEVWEVDNFYEMCPKCKTWNEYCVKAELDIKVKKLEIELDKKRSRTLKERRAKP